MKNQTPRSSTLRCFNDLNSHLSQSAEKGTSWKQKQGKLAITKLLHFMKMAWLFVRLLAHSGSLNLSFIPLEWWKTGWEGWQGRETNPWPSKPHLWLGMESGLAFLEKTVWLCWEKKPVQTVAMILRSRSSLFLSCETSCFRRKNTMLPFSCTYCVNTQKVPCSSLFFEYTEFVEDSVALAPSWGMKRN